MKDYSLTAIGIILGLSILFVSIFLNVELFEMVINELEYLEKYEIDEFLIPSFIIFWFALVDQIKKHKTQQIEHEKIKIYKAMLFSTHHILNNYMNQMMLFKITAKKTPGFDSKVLSMYDEIIKDTSTQIEALGNITDINEESINKSVKPQ